MLRSKPCPCGCGRQLRLPYFRLAERAGGFSVGALMLTHAEKLWEKQTPEGAPALSAITEIRDVAMAWSHHMFRYAHDAGRSKDLFERIPRGAQLEAWRNEFLHALVSSAALVPQELREKIVEIPAAHLALLDKMLRCDRTVLEFFDEARARLRNAAQQA